MKLYLKKEKKKKSPKLKRCVFANQVSLAQMHKIYNVFDLSERKKNKDILLQLARVKMCQMI